MNNGSSTSRAPSVPSATLQVTSGTQRAGESLEHPGAKHGQSHSKGAVGVPPGG